MLTNTSRLVVDGEYLKTQMLFEVQKSEKDPQNKFKASDKWLTGSKKRRGVSHQRIKIENLLQRLLKVKNLHWWAIHQLAKEDLSKL